MRVLEQQSAATFLEQIIAESGIKTAHDKYKEIRSKKEQKYYFDETEFNRLGKKSKNTTLMRLNSTDSATGYSWEEESQRPSKCLK
jgi:hypothetical protein